MINRTSSLSVLITDTCQNVLSYIAETAKYFQLPVVCTAPLARQRFTSPVLLFLVLVYG